VAKARSKGARFDILPYSAVVGQQALKDALELSYVVPSINGVLMSGERGTAKSTLVRGFSQMIYGALPITLPINATEDRVVGGWRIESLMRGKSEAQAGLLEEAQNKLLYIDEVNLLDDHIVNLILDVASTGVLDVQREGFSRRKEVRFTLVGTMNPEEGGLRPQLLDRFGLMVGVSAEKDPSTRRAILEAVIGFDRARGMDPTHKKRELAKAIKADAEKRSSLEKARALADTVTLDDAALDRCIAIARAFELQGHRGEQAMALAAKARVALEIVEKGRRNNKVQPVDVDAVAPLAIRHRRPKSLRGDALQWSDDDQKKLQASRPS
jgi:magnesium chelatase subunit I